MNAFRALLVTIIVGVGIYTSTTIANHGPALFGVFFGDMMAMAWPGQFNLDFMCFLIFSGLWLAWRHHFSPGGIALGIGGVLLGAPYLSIYLLITSFRVHGDVRMLLLGEARAAA